MVFDMEKIEITKEFVSVVKNFITITQNNGFYFHKGNKLRSMSQGQSVYAEAPISEIIDKEFAIYDMRRFLGVISAFDSPVLSVSDNSVIVSEGKSRVNYSCCDPNFIFYPLESSIPYDMLDKNSLCQISDDDLKQIKKVSINMEFDRLTFTTKNGNLVLISDMEANKSGDILVINMGKKIDEEINVSFELSHFNFLPGNYDLKLLRNEDEIVAGLFEDTESGVKYFIASQND